MDDGHDSWRRVALAVTDMGFLVLKVLQQLDEECELREDVELIGVLVYFAMLELDRLVGARALSGAGGETC